MQCPRCSFENERTSTYCERCGTLLQNFEEIEVAGQTEYKAPPPPPLNGHNPPPPPPANDDTTPPTADEASSQPPIVDEWGGMSTPFYNEPGIQATGHIGVFSSILYFVGVLIIAYGMFAILVTFSSGASIGVLGLLLSLVIVIASIVLFIRLFHYIPRLHGWQRILWLLVLTAAAFTLLVISVIVSPSKTIKGVVTSCVIFFYGLAWCIIALW